MNGKSLRSQYESEAAFNLNLKEESNILFLKSEFESEIFQLKFMFGDGNIWTVESCETCLTSTWQKSGDLCTTPPESALNEMPVGLLRSESFQTNSSEGLRARSRLGLVLFSVLLEPIIQSFILVESFFSFKFPQFPVNNSLNLHLKDFFAVQNVRVK